MRNTVIAALSIMLCACGSSRETAASGPRLKATLAASWTVAAPARQAAFTRDGHLLATTDASGLITVRDSRDWHVVQQLQHPGGATSLAFRDDEQLFSAGYDGKIRQWDLRQRKLVGTLTGPRGTIWTIDVSPNGQLLATAGEDKVIRVWTLDTQSAPAQLTGHSRNIWEVRFDKAGARLASGSFDTSVRLWDVKSRRELKLLSGHREAVVGLDYSPDGVILATGADDSTIRFWRSSDGAPLRTIDNGYPVDKVEFSPDGRWLASGGHAFGALGEIWHQMTGAGGNGPSVRLWSTKDGALVASLPHPDDVIYVAFSPDGRWLVTCGEDKRIRLWRLTQRS